MEEALFLRRFCGVEGSDHTLRHSGIERTVALFECLCGRGAVRLLIYSDLWSSASFSIQSCLPAAPKLSSGCLVCSYLQFWCICLVACCSSSWNAFHFQLWEFIPFANNYGEHFKSDDARFACVQWSIQRANVFPEAVTHNKFCRLSVVKAAPDSWKRKPLVWTWKQ